MSLGSATLGSGTLGDPGGEAPVEPGPVTGSGLAAYPDLVGIGPLTVLVTTGTGTVLRMGPDEPDPGWVPMGISFESQVPGGWKQASFNLARMIDEDIPLRLLDEVEIIDEHAQTVYEGRIVKLPRQHGDTFLLGVECLGWASHMLDDKAVPYFYVDRQLGGWQPPSLARRVAMGAVPVDADYSSSVEGGYLQFEGSSGKAVLQFSATELHYQAPASSTIDKVMYRGTEANVGSVEAATLWTDAQDTHSSTSSTALTLDDTLRTATPAVAERYAFMRAMAGPAHTPSAALNRRFSKLAAYGDNGLTSAAISGEPDGYYIDDVLAHALALACPKLNFSTGDGGSIERPGFVISQAADNDLGPVERIVLDLNKYTLYDWLVYHDRTFFYRPPDPDRLVWEARLDRGVHLTLEGDDAEHVYNGAIVKYEVPTLGARVAGPVGSGLDLESELLGDEDPENTANAHGYPAKQIELNVSFPTLDDHAVILGAAYLAQAALPARSGDITVTGSCRHPTMGDRPAREILAGDSVRLSDHPADVARRIIAVRHTDDDQKTVLSVGNDIDRVDAILERLGVQTRLITG